MKASQSLRRPRAAPAADTTPTPSDTRPVGHTVKLSDRLRYRSDEMLSRGTRGVILWLAVITAGVIVVAAVLVTIVGHRFNSGTQSGFVEATWQSLLRVLDSGTMAGDSGWGVRIVALLITLAGIFLASALIGIIATGLEIKIDDLRKGRSFVVESGHTAILGWSPRLFTIVNQLSIANENHPGLAIVVLADRDKTEMEDEIRARIPDLRGSKLVCRTGDPASTADLGIINLEDARSIILLGEDGPGGDAEAVKSLLAVVARDVAVGHIPVVAEITEERTAHALDEAFDSAVHSVRSTEVVARVTAQSCRQSGLSFVVQELLNFEGDEIYFCEVPEVVGHTFAESMLAFETSTLIGIRSADGTITVCPPMDQVFGPGDQVIAVSEDDDTVVFDGFRSVEPLDDVELLPAPEQHEHMLVIGWNHLGPRVLEELDQFVSNDSIADIVVDPKLVPLDEVALANLENFSLHPIASVNEGDAARRLAAERQYTSVIILGYRVGLTASEADARSLLTLLLLDRGIAEGRYDARPRTVVELLDVRDIDLAKVSGADDFVVSDALASLMITQLSEHPELSEVYRQIYTAEGISMYMEPATAYVDRGEMAFGQLVVTTAASGACAIGWRTVVDGVPEVVVNPPKSRRVRFGEDDHLIVIG